MKNSIAFIVTFILSFWAQYFLNDFNHLPKQSGALEALRQWSLERSYPGKTIPQGKYAEAFQIKQQMNKSSEINTDSTWRPIGPQNFGGRTIALAINPVNPNTIYAGSASGGLWVSYTGGEGAKAWQRIETGFPVMAVGAIGINPLDTNNILIGTGEVYNYGKTEGGVAIRETRGSYGMGILKSTDGGKTWVKSLDWAYTDQRGVWSIKFNPENPSTIFAGTTEGIFRSLDAGQTWSNVLDVLMTTDIIIHSNDTNKIIAACGNMGSLNGGVYKSSDGGNTWNKITSNLPQNFGGKITFGYASTYPEIVYASIGNGYWSDAGTWLCKSDDFGETWTVVNTFDYATYQGWFAHIVVMNGNDTNKILTAGVDVYKSTNGGSSLNRKSNWAAWYFGKPPVGGPEGPPEYSHADHHVYAVHPTNPDVVYFGNDGGIFRTTDFGETFEGLNGGYQTQQFYNGFTASLTDSNWAMGGMQDNATAIYDGELAWSRAIGGDGSWTAIDQQNNNIIYGSWQRLNIQKSTDRGRRWSYIAPPGGGTTSFIAPYAVAYDNPQILYAARSLVYKTTNRGARWFTTNSGRALSDNPAIALAIARTNSDYVYVTTAPVNGRGEVFRTTNGGSSWQNVTNNLPDRYPMDIRVAPTSEKMVVVCFSGYGTSHVFKSYDAGDTWEDISNGLPDVPVNAVAIHPTSSNIIFAGTDVGVFMSTDAGISWFDLSKGLPSGVIIKSLQITESNNTMKAATHGNGAYEIHLPDIALSVDEDNRTPNGFSLLQNYPNPFNPTTIIKWQTDFPGYQSVIVYDALGRKIKELFNGFKPVGKHKIEFDASKLAGGIYYYSLHMGGKSITKKMLLLK